MVSQTSVIFFALLVGFIVYITIRGQLAAYLSVLGLGGGSVVRGAGTTGGVTLTLPPLKTQTF